MTYIENKSRQHKEHLYELFSQIGNALSNPHRLELLDLLIQAPHTVEELANLSNMSVANTSQHLQRLKQAHLVMDEREGQFIRYCLADPLIAQLWIDLRQVAERLITEVERELDRYRPHRADIEQISIQELQEGMSREKVFLIDARPEAEFRAGHLPGAVSMPVDALSRRMEELPEGKTLVAYCRGPHCVYADEVLMLLSAHGYPVKRLEEGVAEWQRAGYSLDKEEEEV